MHFVDMLSNFWIILKRLGQMLVCREVNRGNKEIHPANAVFSYKPGFRFLQDLLQPRESVVGFWPPKVAVELVLEEIGKRYN